MSDETITKKSSDKLYEYTTARLDREVDTSRARITRMLYVSGFLFSALALVAELGLSNPVSIVLLFACPLAGAVISFSSIFALQASQAQRDQIKEDWEEHEGSENYPKFYAKKKISRLARLCIKAVPVVFCLIWTSILIAVVIHACATITPNGLLGKSGASSSVSVEPKP
jgi:hypothetical protein